MERSRDKKKDTSCLVHSGKLLCFLWGSNGNLFKLCRNFYGANLSGDGVEPFQVQLNRYIQWQCCNIDALCSRFDIQESKYKAGPFYCQFYICRVLHPSWLLQFISRVCSCKYTDGFIQRVPFLCSGANAFKQLVREKKRVCHGNCDAVFWNNRSGI